MIQTSRKSKSSCAVAFFLPSNMSATNPDGEKSDQRESDVLLGPKPVEAKPNEEKPTESGGIFSVSSVFFTILGRMLTASIGKARVCHSLTFFSTV